MIISHDLLKYRYKGDVTKTVNQSQLSMGLLHRMLFLEVYCALFTVVECSKEYYLPTMANIRQIPVLIDVERRVQEDHVPLKPEKHHKKWRENIKKKNLQK